MKLPQTFIPSNKARIAKKTKTVLKPKKQKISCANLIALLKGFEKFLEEECHDFDEIIVDEIATEIDYSTYDIQAFCNELPKYENHEKFFRTGFYLTALVNKIIKENERITLKLPETDPKVWYLGHEFDKGRLVIHGDTGCETGHWMWGGIMKIYGNIESIDKQTCRGKIYRQKRRVWPEK